MNLQNRLFAGVALMGLAALAAGILCVQSSKGLFDNQGRVYNGSLAVYHLKKVSDAYGLDVIGAVQKVRNGAPWAWEEGGKAIDDAEKTADENWKDYLAMDKGRDEKFQATVVDALINNNKHLMESLKNDFANKDARDLEIQATSVLYPSIGPVLENIRKLEDMNEKNSMGLMDQVEKGFWENYNFMVAAVAVLLIVGMVLGLGMITWALRRMVPLVRGLEGGMDQLAKLATGVSAPAAQLSLSLQESAGQTQRAGGNLEQALSRLQQEEREIAKTKNLIEETRGAMAGGVEAADRTVEYLKGLNQNAEKTFQVVKTIEEIAFQTNILALNAGVEAVRAGEQGKEFVMVVEEIRNLSQRCSQVARETSQLVTENARQASEGLKMNEQTTRNVQLSLEKVGKVASLLAVMEEGVEGEARIFQESRAFLANAEREAYRNSAQAEKTGIAGNALGQQVETLKAVSQQVSALLRAGRRPVKTTRVAHPAASVSAEEQTVSRVPATAEKVTAEMTGTEDGKVIRINK